MSVVPADPVVPAEDSSASKPADGAEPVFDWTALPGKYPKMQGLISKMLQRAWWNHPRSTEWVLEQWLAGRLPGNGVPLLESQFHLRLVAFMGRRFNPSVVALREPDGMSLEDIADMDMDGMADCRDLAYGLAAVDLFDAEGRTIPLLVEYRTDICPDAPGYTQHGGVFHRDNGLQLSESESCDQGTADMKLRAAAIQRVIRHYAPHQSGDVSDMDDKMESLYVEATPGNVTQEPLDEGSALSKEAFADLERMFCAAQAMAVHLASGPYGAPFHAPSCFSQLTHVHPPEVTRRFRLAYMRKAFEGVAGAPTDALLQIIGDFADIQLPYVPITTKPIVDDSGKPLTGLEKLQQGASVESASSDSSRETQDLWSAIPLPLMDLDACSGADPSADQQMETSTAGRDMEEDDDYDPQATLWSYIEDWNGAPE